MYDGGDPPEPVTIERVCSSNSVRPEGYTDSKGHFSFNLGQNAGLFADASTSIFSDLTQQGGLNSGTSSNIGGGTGGGLQDSAYWDCELRARLPGYRSDTVSLAGRRMLDSPDVGSIILYPLAKIQGMIASATSSQAPKDARKAYEKGLEAVKKNKPDQAEQEFRKAVGIYPRYAAAWLELGKALERRDHKAEAREAYASALAADPKLMLAVAAGGDDYEVLAAIGPEKASDFVAAAARAGVPVTRIGTLTDSNDVLLEGSDGLPVSFPSSGWDHF